MEAVPIAAGHSLGALSAEARTTAAAFFEHLPVSIVLVRDDGSEPCGNGTFRAMLRADADSARLSDACVRLGTTILASQSGRRMAPEDRANAVTRLTLSTSAASYHLTGSLCPEPIQPDRVVAAVVVERTGSRTPASVRCQLRDHFHLTEREIDVTLLVVDGLTNREIARHLEISVHTANRHVERLLQKMKARSRTAVAFAITARLSTA